MSYKIEMKTLSSLFKVFPAKEIKLEESDGTMLKNERFAFQLVIKSDTRLIGTKLKITGSGAKYTKFFRVDMVPGLQVDVGDPNYTTGGEGDLFPDVLRPQNPKYINLRMNYWNNYWITVENAPVGQFNINFALFDDQGKQLAKTTYKLNVLGGTLSDDCVYYTNWMHYDCIANYYHLKPFSKKFYKILGAYLDNASNHGVNILYTPLLTPALDTDIGGERTTVQLLDVEVTENGYKLSFNRLKEFIDFARLHGFENFEFSHLFTQWGAKCAPKVVDIKGNKIFGWETSSESEKYLDFLDKLLIQLNDFIADNGLIGHCFAHLSDEPMPDTFERYKKFSLFIKKRLTNAKLIDAMSHMEFYKEKVNDIAVIATDFIQPFLDTGNRDFWAYYCTAEFMDGLSNRFFNCPMERTRVMGIQLYINRIEGFLQWGYNFYNSFRSKWPIDPYLITDADGYLQSGDPFIVYPAPNGVYDSIRHEAFYDGLQDYRALKKLEQLKGRDFVVNLLKNNGYNEGFTSYPHNPQSLINLRKEINHLISENN